MSFHHRHHLNHLRKRHLQTHTPLMERVKGPNLPRAGVLTIIRDVQGPHARDSGEQLLYHAGAR